jgi:hypothetical protein
MRAAVRLQIILRTEMRRGRKSEKGCGDGVASLGHADRGGRQARGWMCLLSG